MPFPDMSSPLKLLVAHNLPPDHLATTAFHVALSTNAAIGATELLDRITNEVADVAGTDNGGALGAERDTVEGAGPVAEDLDLEAEAVPRAAVADVVGDALAVGDGGGVAVANILKVGVAAFVLALGEADGVGRNGVEAARLDDGGSGRGGLGRGGEGCEGEEDGLELHFGGGGR